MNTRMSFVMPTSWVGELSQEEIDDMGFVGKPVTLRNGGPVIGEVVGARVTDVGTLVDMEIDPDYSDLLVVRMKP